MSDLRFRSLSPSQVAGHVAGHVAGVAPAKLNLFLEVLSRRPDGYHELRTVFHEIDLADELRVELRPGATRDSIEVSGLALDVGPERNLALRAAEAFRRHVGDCPRVHVDLEKRIPAGSGMGGGSSDAAFVLRALVELTGSKAGSDRLAVAAREVGADVAFFLAGGTALGAGRGDELTPLPDPGPLVFLLALPRFPLSTATVYSHVDLITPRADVSSFAEGLRGRPRGKPVGGCFNRLEAAASRAEPRIAELLAELRVSTRVDWSMTGSGSTLFAPMSTWEDAASVARSVTCGRRFDLRVVKSFGARPASARS